MNKVKIVLATENKNKIIGMKKHIPCDIFEVYTLSDFCNIDIPEEKGNTFKEIAINKALAVASQIRGNYWVLAEDSGLCVQELGGKPGIYSARFASDHDDTINQLALIEELHKINKNTARAYYKCVMALIPSQFCDVAYNNNAIISEGRMNGRIIDTLKGDNGFGYDSMFVPDLKNIKNDLTLAQIPLSIYDAFTHRTKAISSAMFMLYTKLFDSNLY